MTVYVFGQCVDSKLWMRTVVCASLVNFFRACEELVIMQMLHHELSSSRAVMHQLHHKIIIRIINITVLSLSVDVIVHGKASYHSMYQLHTS